MDEYFKELKRKNIKSFVNEYGYAPKFEQINEMRDTSLKKYTNLTKLHHICSAILIINLGKPFNDHPFYKLNDELYQLIVSLNLKVCWKM